MQAALGEQTGRYQNAHLASMEWQGAGNPTQQEERRIYEQRQEQRRARLREQEIMRFKHRSLQDFMRAAQAQIDARIEQMSAASRADTALDAPNLRADFWFMVVRDVMGTLISMQVANGDVFPEAADVWPDLLNARFVEHALHDAARGERPDFTENNVTKYAPRD